MDEQTPPDPQSGRIALGTVITMVVVLAVAGGLYYALDRAGLLGSVVETEPTVSTSATAGPGADTGAPAWLDGSDRELPLVRVKEDDREPDARVMAEWVWEYVDDDWSTEVVRVGEGDGITYLNDIQVVLLVAPDEERFWIESIRRDYNIDVVHWDAQLALAWLVRDGRPDLAQVVEFDLRNGTTNEGWAGSAAPNANTVSGGVGGVVYVGDQPDGLELWAASDESGFTTGVMWRSAANDVDGSVINSEIARLRLEGFSEDEGVDAWLDPDSMTAVYRATFRIDGTVTEDRWIIHDLSDDDFDYVTPQVPDGADCTPAGTVTSEGQFDGDRIVALCRSGGTGTTVRIDPSGDSAPQ